MASKEQTNRKFKIGNNEISSINDRVESEPNDESFANYMLGYTSHKNSPEKDKNGVYSDYHHEGGDLLTENRNALDTEQMNDELLGSATSPQASPRNANLNVPLRSQRSN